MIVVSGCTVRVAHPIDFRMSVLSSHVGQNRRPRLEHDPILAHVLLFQPLSSRDIRRHLKRRLEFRVSIGHFIVSYSLFSTR